MSEVDLICNVARAYYKPWVVVEAEITIYTITLLDEWNQLHDGIHYTKDEFACVLAMLPRLFNVKFLCEAGLAPMTIKQALLSCQCSIFSIASILHKSW